jgi:hypothetical protein
MEQRQDLYWEQHEWSLGGGDDDDSTSGSSTTPTSTPDGDAESISGGSTPTEIDMDMHPWIYGAEEAGYSSSSDSRDAHVMGSVGRPGPPAQGYLSEAMAIGTGNAPAALDVMPRSLYTHAPHPAHPPSASKRGYHDHSRSGVSSSSQSTARKRERRGRSRSSGGGGGSGVTWEHARLLLQGGGDAAQLKPRPAHIKPSSAMQMFLERPRVKRRVNGSDTWLNSGGQKGASEKDGMRKKYGSVRLQADGSKITCVEFQLIHDSSASLFVVHPGGLAQPPKLGAASKAKSKAEPARPTTMAALPPPPRERPWQPVRSSEAARADAHVPLPQAAAADWRVPKVEPPPALTNPRRYGDYPSIMDPRVFAARGGAGSSSSAAAAAAAAARASFVMARSPTTPGASTAAAVLDVVDRAPSGKFIAFHAQQPDGQSFELGAIVQQPGRGVKLQSPQGDFAEWHQRAPQEAPFEEGDVVGFDRAGMLTRTTRGARMLGVISRRAVVEGSCPPEATRHNWDTVAYTGTVPVKVVRRRDSRRGRGGAAAAATRCTDRLEGGGRGHDACTALMGLAMDAGPSIGDILVPSGRNDGTAHVLPAQSAPSSTAARARVAIVQQPMEWSRSTLGGGGGSSSPPKEGVVIHLVSAVVVSPAETVRPWSRACSVRAVSRAVVVLCALIGLNLLVYATTQYFSLGGQSSTASTAAAAAAAATTPHTVPPAIVPPPPPPVQWRPMPLEFQLITSNGSVSTSVTHRRLGDHLHTGSFNWDAVLGTYRQTSMRCGGVPVYRANPSPCFRTSSDPMEPRWCVSMFLYRRAEPLPARHSEAEASRCMEVARAAGLQLGSAGEHGGTPHPNPASRLAFRGRYKAHGCYTYSEGSPLHGYAFYSSGTCDHSEALQQVPLLLNLSTAAATTNAHWVVGLGSNIDRLQVDCVNYCQEPLVFRAAAAAAVGSSWLPSALSPAPTAAQAAAACGDARLAEVPHPWQFCAADWQACVGGSRRAAPDLLKALPLCWAPERTRSVCTQCSEDIGFCLFNDGGKIQRGPGHASCGPSGAMQTAARSSDAVNLTSCTYDPGRPGAGAGAGAGAGSNRSLTPLSFCQTVPHWDSRAPARTLCHRADEDGWVEEAGCARWCASCSGAQLHYRNFELEPASGDWERAPHLTWRPSWVAL